MHYRFCLSAAAFVIDKFDPFAAEERRKPLKTKVDLKYVCVLGLLVAAEVVLALPGLTVHTWNLKIGFSFIPIVAAAILYGPVAGGLVGAIGDVITAFLFPVGEYFPGFTATAFLTGVIFGVLLHNKDASVWRVSVSVLASQVIISQCVITFFISFLYGSPFWPLFVTRLAQTCAMSAVQFAVILLMSKKLLPVLKEHIKI